MTDEEREDKIAELYEELAQALDTVEEIRSELRELGEHLVS
jgi:ribosomal protein L29